MDSNIKIFVNDIDLQLKSFVFSGGEVQVRIVNIDDIPKEGEAVITSKIYNSDQLMELFLYTSVLRDNGIQNIKLVCPYLPYARQDRACYKGEAFALREFCNLLESVRYKSIEVWDVHSPYSLERFKNITNVTAAQLIEKHFMNSLKKYDYVISPDKGALTRAYEVSHLLNTKLTKAEKFRDPNTGAILRTEVLLKLEDIINNNSVLIVDDICDGGRTFIELAKELKSVGFGKVGLYVTHGIFSKGFQVFEGLIDEIYSPNLFPSKDLQEEIPVSVRVHAA